MTGTRCPGSGAVAPRKGYRIECPECGRYVAVKQSSNRFWDHNRERPNQDYGDPEVEALAETDHVSVFVCEPNEDPSSSLYEHLSVRADRPTDKDVRDVP